MTHPSSPSSTIKNRGVYYNYDILDSWEAGIVLLGEEIKAVRAHGMDLGGSYILIRHGSPRLVGATIPRYRYSSNPQYNPTRERALLLKKGEIRDIEHLLQSKGVTLVPLEAIFKRNILKLKIGLGKGKKKYDKRETIKKREIDREVRRTYSRF